MADENRETGKKPQTDFDLGFGGLFKGLSDFLEVLSDKVEAFEQIDRSGSGQRGAPPRGPRGSVTRTGQVGIKRLGDDAQAVYGVTFRTLADGAPRVERFGNIRHTEEGPVVAEVREPLVDLFDEAGEILVVAEMPGAAEEDVSVELHDDVLVLETSGARRYAREVLLPAAVDPASMHKTFRNGILELKFTKAVE
jgi:HSP20 family protein